MRKRTEFARINSDLASRQYSQLTLLVRVDKVSGVHFCNFRGGMRGVTRGFLNAVAEPASEPGSAHEFYAEGEIGSLWTMVKMVARPDGRRMERR